MAKKRKMDYELEPHIKQESLSEEESSESGEEDDAGSDSEEQDLTKLLEPFSKEQLIELLKIAATNYPGFVAEINRIADRDPAHRKIFVHGLGWDTTSENIRAYFSRYGEIDDCNVVADKVSGKSKGYGFLLFKHRRSAEKALKEPQKMIDNRMTACQLASAGPVSHPQSQHQQKDPVQDTLARKIYVGNVNSQISADKLLAFFRKYGEIEEGPLGFDKQTGKSKGFALFIYKTVEGARKALEEPNKNFDGNQLYCQKATDSHKLKSSAAAGAAAAAAAAVAGGLPEMALAPAALLGSSAGQGFFGALPFNQAVGSLSQNQALAVLAAASQNPAAFGISQPPVMGSLNPALAPPGGLVPAMPQGMQNSLGNAGGYHQGFGGYGAQHGVGNAGGYQNAQGHVGNYGSHSHQAGVHGVGSYPNAQHGQSSSVGRPQNTVGNMGGYVAH